MVNRIIVFLVILTLFAGCSSVDTNSSINQGADDLSSPKDDRDLWEKESWTKMGLPMAQIIGVVEKYDIEDGNLISLSVKVQRNITATGTIKEGETLNIFYYEKLPENYAPVEGDRIMALINHYVTKSGRKIDWGGYLESLWHEKEGKAYNSFGELFRDGISFDEYADSNKSIPGPSTQSTD